MSAVLAILIICLFTIVWPLQSMYSNWPSLAGDEFCIYVLEDARLLKCANDAAHCDRVDVHNRVKCVDVVDEFDCNNGIALGLNTSTHTTWKGLCRAMTCAACTNILRGVNVSDEHALVVHFVAAGADAAAVTTLRQRFCRLADAATVRAQAEERVARADVACFGTHELVDERTRAPCSAASARASLERLLGTGRWRAENVGVGANVNGSVCVVLR